MNNNLEWTVIDKYFTENPYFLTRHNLDSYNDFIKYKISDIFKSRGALSVNKGSIPNTHEKKLNAYIYFGTKTFDKIYINKPEIKDKLAKDNDLRCRNLYPSEARLKNLNYSSELFCDVEIEIIIKKGKEEERKTILYEKENRISLGKIPIMLHSDFCFLKNKSEKLLDNMGECKYEKGGYFIIDGKEKVLISQETKNSKNRLYLKKIKSTDDIHDDIYEILIYSGIETSYKPPYELRIKIVNKKILINIPFINQGRKFIPIFILFRALGIETDKEIINYIFLGSENNEMLEFLKDSVYEERIFTQEAAMNYIVSFLQEGHKSIETCYQVLNVYFLPHLNGTSKNEFVHKAYFLGFMVHRLLKFYFHKIPETDEDSFISKRISLPGVQLALLYRTYYLEMLKDITRSINSNYSLRVEKNLMTFQEMFEIKHLFKIINPNIIENGIIKGFKGIWGLPTERLPESISQELERKSYFSPYAQLRRIKNPISGTALKLVSPHLLHSSQWGMICPLETPDGAQVGIQKHLAISAYVSPGCDVSDLIEFLYIRNVLELTHLPLEYIKNTTKIFVNSILLGIHQDVLNLVYELRNMRRDGILNKYISICWNIQDMELHLNAYYGRIVRPLFIVENQKIRNENNIYNRSWKELLGEQEKYTLKEYMNIPEGTFKFKNDSSIEYIDGEEINCSLICMYKEKLKFNTYFTHCEIHPSLMLGMMASTIPFAEHNQLPRNLFGIGQGKQSIGYYASNYQNRMDQTGNILNYPQRALIETRFTKYYGKLSSLYGFNAIVAFSCYGGYNQEDAIIINKSSVEKGMFSSTHFSTYMDTIVEGKTEEKIFFGNPILNNSKKENISNLKERLNYTKINEKGIVEAEQKIKENDIIIGKYQHIIDQEGKEKVIDLSIVPKKGTNAIVDKSYAYSSKEHSIAKVCLRKTKYPELGDKFSARHGQKGVIGLLIPSCDMPYTKDGIVPDIILNPHCIPKRMTIGQFLECLLSKKAACNGCHVDGTSFLSDSDPLENIDDIMKNEDFHKYGDEVLYNGKTGRQLESKIFIGPTYYMRLKHMVQDKTHSRREGKRQLVTREPTEGRANDGGAKIGEMEKDGLVSHGVFNFIKESYTKRSDDYQFMINNKTGLIDPIYNKHNGINKDEDISLLKPSYSFKLLMHELLSLNFTMRLITK